ncbi:MAG TPA: GAF domain-containing protein [Fimbriimonas sp.]
MAPMIDAAVAHQFLVDLEANPRQGAEFRKAAMTMLDELPGYNWSGIYRLEGDALVLDEYVGAPTDHTRIPVGRGVCGTAVAERENQIVEDVRELSNYLACSTQTRSEIVVLIHRDGEILGQIDIDGHRVGQFDKSDEQFLQRVAAQIAERWE